MNEIIKLVDNKIFFKYCNILFLLLLLLLFIIFFNIQLFLDFYKVLYKIVVDLCTIWLGSLNVILYTWTKKYKYGI